MAGSSGAASLARSSSANHYTLGWCYEFVAHRVLRRSQRGLKPQELYRKAEAYLRRCLELDSDGRMRDDAEDLLSTITKEDVG